jgi:hypothetical protein
MYIPFSRAYLRLVVAVCFHLCLRPVSLARSSLEPALDYFEQIFSFTLTIVVLAPHILNLPIAPHISTLYDVRLPGNRFIQLLKLFDIAGS